MNSPQARALADAIQTFLHEPAPGTPPPVMAGLQNLLDGLRAGPGGQESPGQRAAREVSADAEGETEDSEYQDNGSPGQRAAMQVAKGVMR